MNSGGGEGSRATGRPLCFPACSANQRSTCRHQRRIAQPQVLVGDAEAAGEQVEGELQRLGVVVALDRFEPLEARLGRALEALHLGPPAGFVAGERSGDRALRLERRGQRDGVLHGQLGARADREVRRVGGVAQQHHVPRMPARIPHGGEPPPDGAVRLEPVALQFLLEQVLQVHHGGLLVVLVEPARLPGLLPRLDDEGRATRSILIGMGAPEPGRRRLEVEGESGEGAGGAEPDEAVAPPVEVGLELIGQPLADRAGRPVGGDDQIGGGKAAVGEVPDLALPLDFDPERLRPLREQLQQRLPFHAGEAVPRRPHDGAAVVDLDVLPARGRRGHRLVGLGIGLADVLEGLVGEHHAEAERVLDPVPLVDRHLVARVVALEQDGEIEAGRPGAHDRDLHLAAGSHAGATSRRRPSAVSGVSTPSRSAWSQSLQVTGLCT